MAFKMKRSPVKGKLSNFFKGIFSKEGSSKRIEKQVRKNQGQTNLEKRRAEKKTRKPGESKFQADVRRRQEANKAKRKQKRIEEQSIKLADEKYGPEGIFIKG
jgi:hypothetical protein